jgi:hypothetical protein
MKPNFDTHAAYMSLVNSGILEDQAERILEVLKDSQQDLATKNDLSGLRVEMNARFDMLSLQIKALFVMNAGIIAAIAWFGNVLLDKIK